MPLEEVVAKYGRGEDEQGDDDEATSEVKGESSAPKTLKNPLIAELSKSKKPISPFLRAKTLSRVPKEESADGGSEAAPETAETNEDASPENSSVVKDEAETKKAEPDEVKENGEKPKNGHSIDADEKESPPTVNGDNADTTVDSIVSVKGKGKGKGKSSMSKVSAAAATTEATCEDKNEDDVDAAGGKVAPKKKPAKSAEELYHHVLVADSDADDEDLDDEDDENFDEDEDSEDYEDVVRFFRV